ncbi:unnamed protein product [Candidula unifasciata]|uniref:S-acyl fatty acid synthase thioesterase, medium chain n=1 Tax=Candidula unifasciata TaxID=100452 RepID=A0A8S3YQ23_9EUPU|nr:unnamed protein product [Candidula unifasciata]
MNCRFPRPDASKRMFCFPWAGGGPSFFTAWGEDVSEDIEVFGICLPGRENRYQEPCVSDGRKTIEWIASVIHDQYSDKPFVFYGHSMGALLAFCVAIELKQKYNIEPECLFLSGTTAPHSPHRRGRAMFTESMTKDEFLAKIKLLGGTPSEIFDNAELAEIYYPPLRADMCMIDHLTYEHKPDQRPPLSCPIDFFDGTEDVDHDIQAWKQVTSGQFTFRTMPGGHFFLKIPENTRKLIMFFNIRLGGYDDIV